MEKLAESIEKCRQVKDFDGMYQYANELKKIAQANKDSHYLTIALYHIGNCYYRSGHYTKALSYAMEGVVQGEIDSYFFYLIHLNNLLGMINGSMGDEINAVQYLIKAYYIAKKTNETKYINILLNNLGVLFFDLDFYDIAYDYFLESYHESKKHEKNEININNGFNLVNLTGCSVYLNNEKQYLHWRDKCKSYLEKFVEYTVRNDVIVYDAIFAYQKQELQQAKELICHFIQKCDDDADKLHTFKNLIRLFDVGIEMKDKDICDAIKIKLESIYTNFPEYKKISKLAEKEVKYLLTFNEQEKLEKQLLDYFYLKEEENKINKLNLKTSLFTKIEFERVIFEQEFILKKNEELRKNIEIEEFTKTLNKTSFQKYVNEELQLMHEDQYVGLFVIDIDEFKSINDTKGHLYGDQVLLDIVKTLKKNVRNTDYIGRIGGDEFCIFIKNVLSIEFFFEKANKLIDDIRNTNQNNDISVSVGICITSTKHSFTDLFKKADEAMYTAKKLGGDQYRYVVLAD